MKWTHTGLRFQTSVKASSVHMNFHFGCISKRPDILIDMCRPFISGSVYMIFHHPKWNFISVKITDMKSIPTMSFKRTCALSATSNESALIHFVSGELCSHENLTPVWNFHFGQNDRYEIHTDLCFISPQFMWTQVKSWLNTEVRFSTEMKSHTGLSSFHLSVSALL